MRLQRYQKGHRMGRSKKQSTPLQSYESTKVIRRGGKTVNDSYARITDSLLLSEAFKDLKPHVQILYICMRNQDFGKRKPSRDYDEKSSVWEKVKDDRCFYYPWHTAKLYSDRYKNNSGRLYRDIDILVKHGFIELILSGRNTRKNTVYKYSDKWQQWKKPPP